jgi:hypothetical protein
VIGIDANAASMADASRRAARPVKRGGLPNALFVVAAAENLPSELGGWAEAVTVHFPWGSLLRGLLAGPHGSRRGAPRQEEAKRKNASNSASYVCHFRQHPPREGYGTQTPYRICADFPSDS